MNPSDVPIPKQGVVFDAASHQVAILGATVSLSKTEFHILRFLADLQGGIGTRRQIIEAVHGRDYPVTERSVDFQVASIRRKLGPAGKLLQTVRGVGFRFNN